MKSTSASPRWPEQARFYLLIGLLIGCCLWGGGSRVDIPGLIFLQPLAILLTAAIVAIPGEIRWTAIRVPLLFLAALALLIAIQLVPLPPEWWAQLPGHAPFAEILRVAGVEPVWRPISLTPDLTLASLVGLVIPAAALVGFAAISEEQGHRLLPWLLGIAGFSAVLGVAQAISGENSPLYLYSITNKGAAVGLFSNRNHEAVFLAAAFPMLAVWVARPVRLPTLRTLKIWVAGAASMFLVLATAMTGSRAGLGLMVVAIGCAWLLWRRSGVRLIKTNSRLPWLSAVVPVIGISVLVAIGILVSRSEAVQRLFGLTVAEDARVEAMPVLLTMIGDFFPLGSGFGSFDPVFRHYEPTAMLRGTYFNHAHNDLIELAITGGLPALLLMLAFLIWATTAFLASMRRGKSSAAQFAGFSTATIAIMLMSSIVDYPLRTPLVAVFFALACAWLAQASANRGAARSSTEGKLLYDEVERR